jgi:hypothetical protein
MESNLRPLTLSEILDRTAQLYRENFLLFAGISAVYAGAVLVLNLLHIGLVELLKALHVAGALLWVDLAAGGTEALIIILLYGATVAAINRAVAWVHLGETTSIRGAYAGILPRLGSYLWLMTITAVVVFTPIVLLYGGYFGTMAYFAKAFGAKAGATAAQQVAANPQATAIALGASLAFILLLLPVGIYTIWMSLRYALALPASVVESLKARQALRRAVELSKGSRGRIFVLGLLVAVIKIGMLAVTQLFVFVSVFKHHGQIGPGLSAISQIIAFFTNTFLGPIYATGLTLFYYDQRVRKEGYDIEWMMQAAGLTVPEARPTASSEPQSEA